MVNISPISSTASMALYLSNDTWQYVCKLSKERTRLYCIYRCNTTKCKRTRCYHDISIFADLCITSKNLIGWSGSLAEAKTFAYDYHNAKFCGRINYTYVINAYAFPFVLSTNQRYDYNALASYKARPVPRFKPFVWQASERPICVLMLSDA